MYLQLAIPFANTSTSEAPPYAGVLAEEAKVEKYKANLAGRKDRVEELRLLMDVGAAEEAADAKKELIKLLKTSAPSMTE